MSHNRIEFLNEIAKRAHNFEEEAEFSNDWIDCGELVLVGDEIKLLDVIPFEIVLIKFKLDGLVEEEEDAFVLDAFAVGWCFEFRAILSISSSMCELWNIF